MGDIGPRQVRYEVLALQARPVPSEAVEVGDAVEAVHSAADADMVSRRADARTEPARS